MVKAGDTGITVDVYTVMSYGVKISEVSKNIQERVKFNLENQLGLTADMVNVYVQNIKVVGEKTSVQKLQQVYSKKWCKQPLQDLENKQNMLIRSMSFLYLTEIQELI